MHNQILLTGATGALGPALAAQLAITGAAERIAILMRTPDNEIQERFNRWIDAVRSLLPPDQHHHLKRLHPASGDICRENLGITNNLHRDTDVVIHAAADTNFSSPQKQQWEINVEGTRRTLQWAADCPNLRRFLLVSSVFVSGSRTGRIDETATTQPPEAVTYYQRTKWEAEQVALATGMPVGVARVSLVLGSHATGGVHSTGAVHSLIKWFARGLVPIVPGNPAATGDVIATETAAQCLAHAVMTDNAVGGWNNKQPPIWHIAAGTHAPRMMEIIDFVYDHFSNRPAWRKRKIPRPRMVEQQEFDHFIEKVDTAGRSTIAQALRSVNRFLPDLLFPKTYETARAEALWGGPLPRYDWRETLTRVIHFCCPPQQNP